MLIKILFFFFRQDGLHVPHITLTYHHKGQRILIDLKRNDNLLPDEHFLRYQNSNSSKGHVVQNFTKTDIDLCHYQVRAWWMTMAMMMLMMMESFYFVTNLYISLNT